MNKRLVGGVFLLCLTAMTLTLSEDGETYTNITQPEILEQLTNLKTFISNPKMIKPVWVQLKNGDEIVVVQGELKVVDTGEFEICVKLNGYKLIISIEFTQVLNSDDEPLDDWYIDTNDAKYLFTSDAQNVKATIEDANFGDVELSGDLSVAGDVSGDAITGNSIIENMSGYSATLGTSNEHYTIENVYHGAVKNGNKVTFVSAVNFTNIDNTADVLLAKFTIPNDIGSKLYPVATSGSLQYVLSMQKVCALNDLRVTKQVTMLLEKQSNTTLNVFILSNDMAELDANDKYYLRIECTFLLSDNLISNE